MAVTNCHVQAYVAAGSDRLEYHLNTVTKYMAEMGLQPTKKMNTLGLEASLSRNNLEVSITGMHKKEQDMQTLCNLPA